MSVRSRLAALEAVVGAQRCARCNDGVPGGRLTFLWADRPTEAPTLPRACPVCGIVPPVFVLVAAPVVQIVFPPVPPDFGEDAPA